jgi:hypothetical protein
MGPGTDRAQSLLLWTRDENQVLLSSSQNSAAPGQRVAITATISAAEPGSAVRFRSRGRVLPGCRRRPVLARVTAWTATCRTRAPRRGPTNRLKFQLSRAPRPQSSRTTSKSLRTLGTGYGQHCGQSANRQEKPET